MNKLSIALFVFVATGCSHQIHVHTDSDPTFEAGNYHSFDWDQKTNIEAGKNPIYYNELNDKRIKSSVAVELARRGYTLSDTNPELFIHYHIIVEDQSVLIEEPYAENYSSSRIRPRTNVYLYREGTLILDMMDAKTNELVWRGWATSSLDQFYTPQEKDDLIKTAVEKIFRKYPSPIVTSLNSDLSHNQ